MFKPLNQLNAIFDSILDLNLSGNEQLVLFHLFDAFNRAHWTESLKLSDETLRLRLNQYDSTGKPITIETVRRAKQKLKSKGLIDFTSGKGSRVSEYKLTKLYDDCDNLPCGHPASSPVDTPASSPVDTSDDTGLVSYTPARAEDTKTQTERREDTVGGGVARATHAGGSDGNGEGEKPAGGVKNIFVALFQNPDWNDEYVLSELEKTYGEEMVVEAIRTAFVNKHAKDKNLLAYIRGILNNKKATGGMRNGSITVKATDSEDDRFAYRKQYADL